MGKTMFFPVARLLLELGKHYRIKEDDTPLSDENLSFKHAYIVHELHGFEKIPGHLPDDDEKKFSIIYDGLGDRLAGNALYHPMVFIEPGAGEEESDKIRKLAEKYADVI